MLEKINSNYFESDSESESNNDLKMLSQQIETTTLLSYIYNDNNQQQNEENQKKLNFSSFENITIKANAKVNNRKHSI